SVFICEDPCLIVCQPHSQLSTPTPPTANFQLPTSNFQLPTPPMLNPQDIRGRVFKNASATLLARITDADGDNIVPDDIDTLRYSVLEIDPVTPDTLTPVEGHNNVELEADEIFFDTLQTDPPWDP